MGINKIEEILKYAETIHQELQDCYFKLEDINNVLFTKWQEKDNLRRRIRDLEYEESRIHAFLNKYSDFDKEKFMIFLREIINSSGNSLVFTKFKTFDLHYDRNPGKKNSLYEFYSRETRSVKTNEKTHYILTDPSIAEFITNNGCGEVELQRYHELGLFNNSIHLPEDNFYIFDKDFSLNDEFLKFDGLSYYLYALIQSKIDFPDMSDYERFKTVMSSVSSKQKRG